MTLKHRRQFTRDFKLQVLAQIAAGKSIAQAAREHQLHPTLKGIHISMSRTGNPYDKAKAERFRRTLKYEEVYLFDYETMAEARARISHFLEGVYNQKRLQSALGYLPPAEYEQQLCQSTHA